MVTDFSSAALLLYQVADTVADVASVLSTSALIATRSLRRKPDSRAIHHTDKPVVDVWSDEAPVYLISAARWPPGKR